jgi:hypothetical protein
MRFNRSFVSGFLATSGDFGPPSPPCFGSHGAGAGGFCVLSGIPNITDLQARTQLVRGQKGFGKLNTEGRAMQPEWSVVGSGRAGARILPTTFGSQRVVGFALLRDLNP